jgi:hypothetical protein
MSETGKDDHARELNADRLYGGVVRSVLVSLTAVTYRCVSIRAG